MNQQALSSFIWSVADLLRGDYQQSGYGTQPLDTESPWYPDVVEVVGDLVKRSLADLDVLYEGYLPNPVLAARKIER